MPAWFEVTVDVPLELSETVSSYLFDLGTPGLEYVDRDGTASLVAYFRDQPPIDRLRSLCTRLSQSSVPDWIPAIRSRLIEEEDWAEDWKHHFRPTAIGHRLQICPPWEIQIVANRENLIIDPGMAFGTGQHPTTRGCLELIESSTRESPVVRALDVGTGSGILAIALAKLGVAEVQAIDSDPQACTIAIENSGRNSTAEAVFVTDRWELIAGRFDLIVANLFTDLLREFAPKLLGMLNPNGRFVCSGFLTSDESAITTAYSQLRTIGRREEESWVTLLLAADGLVR